MLAARPQDRSDCSTSQPAFSGASMMGVGLRSRFVGSLPWPDVVTPGIASSESSRSFDSGLRRVKR